MPKNTDSLRKAIQNDSDKMRTIDMQVDTVSVDGANGTAGYYKNGDFTDNYNTITLNYIKDRNYTRDYTAKGTTLIHEQKHRDNYLQGIYAYAVSPEQAYKRTMHDEISANMTELVALRDEYIETGDISVFDKEPQFGFYKEAIERGEINPRSTDPVDFDKDMRLVFNGTREMWMNEYAPTDIYVDLGLYYQREYADSEGKYAAYWDENYANSLKIAYNIGGVDFTKYMDEDVEVPHRAYDKMLQNIGKDPSYQQSYHLSDADIFEMSGLPAYDGSVSLSEYKQLLGHQMAVNDAFSNVWNENGKRMTPQEVLQHMASDEYREEHQTMYENYAGLRGKYPDVESFMYEETTYAPETLSDSFAKTSGILDKIVEYQAQEYAKTGKEFPADNPENYQKALDNIYCGSYNLLKIEGNTVNPELSDKTHEIVAQSQEGFADRVKRGLEDLQYRCTHITDKGGETHEVSLWGKIVYKLGEAKNNVSNWFGGEKTETSEVKNEPINPVNRQDPQYRQWKDEEGSRVSPVQHIQILDITRSIIDKPEFSAGVVTDVNSAVIIPMDNTAVKNQIIDDHDAAMALQQRYMRELQIQQPTRSNPLQETNDRAGMLNANFRRNMKQHGF